MPNKWLATKVYGGQRQYIPLKVNSAGVMPIIFAQSINVPCRLWLAGYFAESSDVAQLYCYDIFEFPVLGVQFDICYYDHVVYFLLYGNLSQSKSDCR